MTSRSGSQTLPPVVVDAGGSLFHTLLIVDDDVALLSAWKRQLHGSHVVLTACDAGTALELARKTRLDLAIVDLNLGTSSGISLMHDLRQTQPGLPIALMSGLLDEGTTIESPRGAPDAFVDKSAGCTELLRRIARQLAEREAASPAPNPRTLEQAEAEHILRVLEECNGNITLAARRLAIGRRTLQRRLKSQEFERARLQATKPRKADPDPHET